MAVPAPNGRSGGPRLCQTTPCVGRAFPLHGWLNVAGPDMPIAAPPRALDILSRQAPSHPVSCDMTTTLFDVGGSAEALGTRRSGTLEAVGAVRGLAAPRIPRSGLPAGAGDEGGHDIGGVSVEGHPCKVENAGGGQVTDQRGLMRVHRAPARAVAETSMTSSTLKTPLQITSQWASETGPKRPCQLHQRRPKPGFR